MKSLEETMPCNEFAATVLKLNSQESECIEMDHSAFIAQIVHVSTGREARAIIENAMQKHIEVPPNSEADFDPPGIDAWIGVIHP